jgi:hypothetical protein
MKEQLKAIIEEIKQACIETGMTNVTNDEIVSDATAIYINTNTFRAEAIATDISQQQSAGNSASNPMELASDKQKSFLKQLGYKENMDNMTKREASEVINKLKNKAK